MLLRCSIYSRLETPVTSVNLSLVGLKCRLIERPEISALTAVDMMLIAIIITILGLLKCANKRKWHWYSIFLNAGLLNPR
jgi:hypothetical protein